MTTPTSTAIRSIAARAVKRVVDTSSTPAFVSSSFAPSSSFSLLLHDSPSEHGNLLRALHANGSIHPRDITLHNTLEFLHRGWWPSDITRIFSTTSDGPQYTFLLDLNPAVTPFLCVRSPACGHHNMDLLRECIPQLVAEMGEGIAHYGAFQMECDEIVRPLFIEALDAQGMGQFSMDFTEEYNCFYMNDQQMNTLKKMELTAPAGFVYSSVDADADYELIHSKWWYGKYDSALSVKQRLERLPSMAMRTTEGRLASWEMTHNLGTLSNLYTVPEFRGCGVGEKTKMALEKKFAMDGLQIMKFIGHHNEGGIRKSLANPMLSLWRKDNGEAYTWTMVVFKKK